MILAMVSSGLSPVMYERAPSKALTLSVVSHCPIWAEAAVAPRLNQPNNAMNAFIPISPQHVLNYSAIVRGLKIGALFSCRHGCEAGGSAQYQAVKGAQGPIPGGISRRGRDRSHLRQPARARAEKPDCQPVGESGGRLRLRYPESLRCRRSTTTHETVAQRAASETA
jgi:hypothetical protein